MSKLALQEVLPLCPRHKRIVPPANLQEVLFFCRGISKFLCPLHKPIASPGCPPSLSPHLSPSLSPAQAKWVSRKSSFFVPGTSFQQFLLLCPRKSKLALQEVLLLCPWHGGIESQEVILLCTQDKQTQTGLQESSFFVPGANELAGFPPSLSPG